jgi:hypothetical protein
MGCVFSTSFVFQWLKLGELRVFVVHSSMLQCFCPNIFLDAEPPTISGKKRKEETPLSFVNGYVEGVILWV